LTPFAARNEKGCLRQQRRRKNNVELKNRNIMKNRRKKEIESCLRELHSYSYGMSRALRRDDANGEIMCLRMLHSTLELIDALHEELERLRGG